MSNFANMGKEDIAKLQQIRDLYKTVRQDIIGRTLSKRVVHSVIIHLPIRNISKGWSQEIYELSDKFLQELYQYSKEMKYVDENITFEEFIKQ